METFYGPFMKKLARGALAGGHEAALREVEKLDFDPHQLDCLLNPKRYAPIWRLAPCDCGEGVIRLPGRLPVSCHPPR